ncbi:relaxase/mobilization nuclease domain-containing protein [Mucilaginibacter defluvii]|uniref:relaxase/mobilization nuclease domain-containing protein n=1 Tax=Mucilaginibacter defluvii TaxID=1196019 RepID=UPI0031E87846
MIASQKIGKSFMGAFRYNEKKAHNPDKSKRAILLDSNFTAVDHWGIQREVEIVKSLRPSLNRYVYHTSLNFHKDDRLDNKTLLAIAHEYLLANGFGDNQYMIYRHFDADHPHLHLLVNRIRFDGSVVSDSNNYRKSEAIIRKLEERYNLVTVESAHCVTSKRHSSKSTNLNNYKKSDHGNMHIGHRDNHLSVEPGSDLPTDRYNIETLYQDNNLSLERRNLITRRAPTKDELEMINRTGLASEKLLLQEKLSLLLPARRVSIQEIIERCERYGISLLFNQASTGRVSGITYFHNEFKIRGQALGNRFKWNEILKHIDYEQGRDSAAISAANDRTRAKYDHRQPAATFGNGHRIERLPANDKGTHRKDGYHPTAFAGDHTAAGNDRTGVEEKQSQSPGADLHHSIDSHPESYRLDTALNISISDDVDDEAIYGRDRHRQKKARINRR